MTLHAAWVMDTAGRERGAQGDRLIKFYGAQGAARRHRPRAADPRVARLLDRHAARGDVPLRARRRASTTGPTRSTASRSRARSCAATSRRRRRPERARARPGARRRASASRDLLEAVTAQRLSAGRLPIAHRGSLRRVAASSSAARCPAVAVVASDFCDRSSDGRRRRRAGHAAGGAARARRPLRRATARSRCCASRSSGTGRGRPARRRSRALAARLRRAAARAGASSRAGAHAGCATSSARSRARGRRSSSARTTTPKDEPPGFVGANDGAGGTAAVVELARRCAAPSAPRGAPELRFVLFDGEEEPTGCERLLRLRRCAARKAYVRAPRAARSAR